jgi:hypothetical protein
MLQGKGISSSRLLSAPNIYASLNWFLLPLTWVAMTPQKNGENDVCLFLDQVPLVILSATSLWSMSVDQCDRREDGIRPLKTLRF